MVVNRNVEGSFGIVSGTPYACLEELRSQGIHSSSRIVGISSIYNNENDVYVMYYTGARKGLSDYINYWEFKQVTVNSEQESTIYDTSGNGKTATIYAGAGIYVNGVDSMVSGALFLSGTAANSAQFGRIDADSNTIGSKGSISVWVKPTKLDAEQNVYEEVVSGVRAWMDPGSGSYIRVYSEATAGHVHFTFTNYSEETAGLYQMTLSGAALNLSAWNHIAVTCDGSTTRLYVNGAEGSLQSGVNTGQWTNDLITSGTNVRYIGTFWISGIQGSYFNGSIDNLRIYDKGLSTNEVRQLQGALL